MFWIGKYHGISSIDGSFFMVNIGKSIYIGISSIDSPCSISIVK
jgi:hypothetical protein